MAGRRLALILALAATTHVVGIARNPLPAQDGFKFLRVARGFQREPWLIAVRDSDQHPLYPALVAVVEPIVAYTSSKGPQTWRIAAQAVAALAALIAIIPLMAIARTLFDERTAVLAALLWIALPGPSELGRETLSDTTALAAGLGALALGIRAAHSGSLPAGILSGSLAGLGYLARPEVAIVPVALVIAMLTDRGANLTLVALKMRTSKRRMSPTISEQTPRRFASTSPRLSARLAGLGVPFLLIVGLYAIAKGEVSEKLSVRSAAGLATSAVSLPSASRSLTTGLDDDRWDFAPKEESATDADGWGPGEAAVRVAIGVERQLTWPLLALAGFGLVRCVPGFARRALVVQGGLFAIALARHASTFGYLSDRHTLTLAALALPFAAGGITRISEGVRRRFGLDERRAVRTRWGLAIGLGVVGLFVAARGGHPSRWGHAEAGRWIARHARPGDAMLDTRGWASFTSGVRSYDPWHIRQALTDSRLAFVVVGADELRSSSRRAATLRALLNHAAEPAAAFPGVEGAKSLDILVYRYRRPESWEGIGR